MNRSFLKWVGWILLVIILIAAAFVGGQLLNGRVNPLGAGGGSIDGDTFQPMEISVVPAEELPSTPPEEAGTFVRREDDSIFIGIGDTGNSDEAPGTGESSTGGVVVEVVTNNETTVYQEVLNLNVPSEAGEIQQEVTESTIEAIGDGSFMWVWGRKTGDRIIADVLLYSVPMVKPGTAP